MEEKANNKKAGENTTDIEKSADSKDSFLILSDTSWLVAILDDKDSHHVSATSSLGALLPYGPVFYVPVVVYMETVSRLIRVNGMSVKKCQEKVLKFFNEKLHAKGSELKINFRDINARYKICSRQSIKKLTTIDFYIVTEGISLGAKILTCDLKMYRHAQKYYSDIYFMTDKVEAQESDLARLIHNIQAFKK